MKTKLKKVLENAMVYLFKVLKENREFNTELFINQLIMRIEEVYKPKDRSLPEHRFYWAFIRWLTANFPERIFDFKVSEKLVHELLKSKFQITSTAFSEMTQEAFHKYFNDCKEWTAIYLLKCDPKDINEMIGNEVDSEHKQSL